MIESVTLNNGVEMPLEGFGVFQVPDPAQCEQAVLDAIESGYRLIDTAAAYMNETAVGAAIKKCSVPREQLFIARLADFCETVEVKPAVNQVELHPFFQQENALALMKEYGVHPEAWGPFAEGNHGIFTHPVLKKIGDKYGKSPAQVALRWNVQRGVTVIPKSVHKERMEQNLNIWDFKLSQEDMDEIAKMDLGHSEIVNHDDPAFAKMLHNMKIHN